MNKRIRLMGASRRAKREAEKRNRLIQGMQWLNSLRLNEEMRPKFNADRKLQYPGGFNL